MDIRKNGLAKFEIFAGGTGGIDSWLAQDGDPVIADSLIDLANKPLTRDKNNCSFQ